MKLLLAIMLLSFSALSNAELYFYVVKAGDYKEGDSFTEIQKKALIIASCYNPELKRGGSCMQEIIANNLSVWIEHDKSRGLYICQVSEIDEQGKYTIALKTSITDVPDPKDTTNGKYICARTSKNWGARR